MFEEKAPEEIANQVVDAPQLNSKRPVLGTLPMFLFAASLL
jgi:hypothetical protein